MKERPILMTTESVKAILEGSKTQTRRVVKDPRRYSREREAFLSMSPSKPSIGDIERDLRLNKDTKPNYPCPYGQVGDLLWVRETWATEKRLDHLSGSELGKAGDIALWFKTEEIPSVKLERGRWRSGRFMPRWASRITLEIAGLRVERLQEIAAEDCEAEGIISGIPLDTGLMEEEAIYELDLIERFKLLWDSLNAKRGYSWESNPWVWVISFRRKK